MKPGTHCSCSFSFSSMFLFVFSPAHDESVATKGFYNLRVKFFLETSFVKELAFGGRIKQNSHR